MAFDQLTDAVAGLIASAFQRAKTVAGSTARDMFNVRSFRAPPSIASRYYQQQAAAPRVPLPGLPTTPRGFTNAGSRGLSWLTGALHPAQPRNGSPQAGGPGAPVGHRPQTAPANTHGGAAGAQNVTIANWPSGLGSSPGGVGGSAPQSGPGANLLHNVGANLVSHFRGMFGGALGGALGGGGGAGSAGAAHMAKSAGQGGAHIISSLVSSVSHMSGAMKTAMAGGGAAGAVGAAVAVMRWGLAMNHASVEKIAGMAHYNTGLQDSYLAMGAADNARNYRVAAQLAPSARGVTEAETAWRDASAGFGSRLQELKNNISAPITQMAAKEVSGVNSMWDTASVAFGFKSWDDLRKQNQAAKNAANNYMPLSELVHQIGAGQFTRPKFKRLAPLNK